MDELNRKIKVVRQELEDMHAVLWGDDPEKSDLVQSYYLRSEYFWGLVTARHLLTGEWVDEKRA